MRGGTLPLLRRGHSGRPNGLLPLDLRLLDLRVDSSMLIRTVIGLCLDRNRLELCRRAERLRRQHGPGEIEAEELARTIVVSQRHATQSQASGTNGCNENAFQDRQKGLLKSLEQNSHHVGTRPRE